MGASVGSVSAAVGIGTGTGAGAGAGAVGEGGGVSPSIPLPSKIWTNGLTCKKVSTSANMNKCLKLIFISDPWLLYRGDKVDFALI